MKVTSIRRFVTIIEVGMFPAACEKLRNKVDKPELPGAYVFDVILNKLPTSCATKTVRVWVGAMCVKSTQSSGGLKLW